MSRGAQALLAALLLLALPASAGESHHGHAGPSSAIAAAWVEGSLCEADPPTPLAGMDGHVGFAGNATHVAMRVHGHHGFAAFGVATGHTVHTLVAMQEVDMAIHALTAAVFGDAGLAARTGEAGIPTATAPPPPGHEGMDHDLVTQFAYDDEGGSACITPQGWLTLGVARTAIPEGREWPVLVALDPTQDFLPRPIDSTSNGTFRLVAAMPGEDVMELQAALDAAGKGGRDSPGLSNLWLAAALACVGFLARSRTG